MYVAMEEDKIGYLEEYRSLREEILKRQEARNFALGLTITAIGTIIGLSLSIGKNIEFKELISALIIFSFVLTIAAVTFTIHQTQQIDIISTYIRMIIEPNVKGIRWETTWALLREKMISKRKKKNEKLKLRLGTSKILAVYYLFITIILFILVFFLPVNCSGWLFFVIIVLTVSSLAFELDLIYRFSKGWKVRHTFEELCKSVEENWKQSEV